MPLVQFYMEADQELRGVAAPGSGWSRGWRRVLMLAQMAGISGGLSSEVVI